MTYPQILGDSTAGVMAELEPDVMGPNFGGKVFGFTYRNPKEKGQ